MADETAVTVVTQFAIRGGRFGDFIVGRDDAGDIFVQAENEPSRSIYLDDSQAAALAATLQQVLR